MAEESERLERWTDPVLGEFTWDPSGVWLGAWAFNGRTVQLVLDPDNTDPTREEQLAVFEPARPVLARLPEVGARYRRKCSAMREALARVMPAGVPWTLKVSAPLPAWTQRVSAVP